jgi:hypothetical protein
MSALPKDQDLLLKELRQFEKLERDGILPERSNTNLFLIVFTWILGTAITLIYALRGEVSFISNILIVCFIASITFYLSYRNSIIGFISSCILITIISLYAMSLNDMSYSNLIVLLDGMVIFVFANQFMKTGYVIGAVFIIVKLLVVQIALHGGNSPEDIISIIINVLIFGGGPVLINMLSKVSRKAKIEELRAELLSIQNQELVQSWGNFYKPTEKKVKEKVNKEEKNNEGDKDDPNFVYASPYGNSV